MKIALKNDIQSSFIHTDYPFVINYLAHREQTKIVSKINCRKILADNTRIAPSKNFFWKKFFPKMTLMSTRYRQKIFANLPHISTWNYGNLHKIFAMIAICGFHLPPNAGLEYYMTDNKALHNIFGVAMKLAYIYLTRRYIKSQKCAYKVNWCVKPHMYIKNKSKSSV